MLQQQQLYDIPDPNEHTHSGGYGALTVSPVVRVVDGLRGPPRASAQSKERQPHYGLGIPSGTHDGRDFSGGR